MKTVLALCLIAFSSMILAKNISFSSGDYQNTMLELYTSEGCSSCPSAEKWINSFIDHPGLFSKIVPLAFHVDYWDYIGWKDKFSKPKYSKRQRRHYAEGNVSQVYTPGVMLNGKEYRVWRYSPNIKDVLGTKVGKLNVDVIDNIAYIKFSPQQKVKGLLAHVALLGFGFENKITAGENNKKTLKHDFVVLDYVNKLSNVNRWSMKLPTSSKIAQQYAVAVWITKRDSLKPIQVSANWL